MKERAYWGVAGAVDRVRHWISTCRDVNLRLRGRFILVEYGRWDLDLEIQPMTGEPSETITFPTFDTDTAGEILKLRNAGLDFDDESVAMVTEAVLLFESVKKREKVLP